MNVQTVNFQGLFFINVAKPTDFEMKFLKNTYDFNSLNLEDYLHKTQIPKIENHEKYDLIVVRFPIFSENVVEDSYRNGRHLLTNYTPKKRLISSYVNFFVSKEYVIVLHDGLDPQVIDPIFTLCQQSIHNRTEYMGKGPVFLTYKIMDALVDSCFPVINALTATIGRIDKELEDKQSQKTFEEISITRRNLVVFHTMIKPILPVFKELAEGKHAELDDGSMRPYWGNVLDHLQKILDRVDDNKELLDGVSESSEFLLRSKTNQIMAALTIAFTLTIPAATVGTLYGMNIILPGGINEAKTWYFWGPYTTFIIISILSIAPAVLMILYFKRKKWF